MRTNYAAHEAVYQRRRSEGKLGWQDAEAFAAARDAWQLEFDAAHVPTSGRLLELGCGAGDFSLWLAAKGYEVHGIDISPTAIDWAREKAEERSIEAQFHLGCVLRLDACEDANFDIVVDGYCLHCIIAQDRALFFGSARRVLKSSGLLHVRTMCAASTDDVLQNLSPARRQEFHVESRCMLTEDGMATRYIGHPTTVLQEVQDAGLDVIQHRIKPPNGTMNSMDELILWARRR